MTAKKGGSVGMVWEIVKMPWFAARVTSDLVLEVYVSPACRRGDPVLDPLAKWAAGFTYTLLSQEIREDPDMMFGRADRRLYQLAERRVCVRTP